MSLAEAEAEAEAEVTFCCRQFRFSATLSFACSGLSLPFWSHLPAKDSSSELYNPICSCNFINSHPRSNRMYEAYMCLPFIGSEIINLLLWYGTVLFTNTD